MAPHGIDERAGVDPLGRDPGRWDWDPKETWAFITWVIYAACLNAEATTGERGVKASWFSLLGYAAFIFNFFGVDMWISALNSFAGL